MGDTCNNSSSKWKSNDFGSWKPVVNGNLIVVGASGEPVVVVPTILLLSKRISTTRWLSCPSIDSQDTIAFSDLSGVGQT